MYVYIVCYFLNHSLFEWAPCPAWGLSPRACDPEPHAPPTDPARDPKNVHIWKTRVPAAREEATGPAPSDALCGLHLSHSSTESWSRSTLQKSPLSRDRRGCLSPTLPQSTFREPGASLLSPRELPCHPGIHRTTQTCLCSGRPEAFLLSPRWAWPEPRVSGLAGGAKASSRFLTGSPVAHSASRSTQMSPAGSLRGHSLV